MSGTKSYINNVGARVLEVGYQSYINNISTWALGIGRWNHINNFSTWALGINMPEIHKNSCNCATHFLR